MFFHNLRQLLPQLNGRILKQFKILVSRGRQGRWGHSLWSFGALKSCIWRREKSVTFSVDISTCATPKEGTSPSMIAARRNTARLSKDEEIMKKTQENTGNINNIEKSWSLGSLALLGLHQIDWYFQCLRLFYFVFQCHRSRATGPSMGLSVQSVSLVTIGSGLRDAEDAYCFCVAHFTSHVVLGSKMEFYREAFAFRN